MRLLGLVVALVLAVGVGFVVIKAMEGDKTPVGTVVQPTTSDVQKTTILVAARPINVGEVIEPDMVRTQDWPQHMVLDGFISTGDKSVNIVKMVARASFQENEPVLLSKLSNPADPNFLAAGLAEGHKAVSISVDNISSVAGFIYPGDRVDVIVTHELPKASDSDDKTDSAADNKQQVTESLLTNVKVLAVDDRATAGAMAPQGENQRKAPTSVSLDVTLEDAQKLRLAQETGYVSLALRALKDKDVHDSAPPTFVPNLTMTDAYSQQQQKAAKEPVRIVRGIATEEVNMLAAPGGMGMAGGIGQMNNGMAAGASQTGSAMSSGPAIGTPMIASPQPAGSPQAPQTGAPRIAR